MPQKNAGRDATHCPMCNLNAESLFTIQHANIEQWSVRIFVITHFLSFPELGLDSDTALEVHENFFLNISCGNWSQKNQYYLFLPLL